MFLIFLVLFKKKMTTLDMFQKYKNFEYLAHDELKMCVIIYVVI